MKKMLIIVLVCLGVLLTSYSVSGQNQLFDKIILKDSTELIAKIKTVTENLIYYQLTSSDSIQNLEIKKNLVAKIIYGNGDIEIVSQTGEIKLPEKPTIVYTEKPWLQNDFLNYISLYDREILLGANDFYKNKIQRKNTIAFISGVLGGSMTIVGIVLVSNPNKVRSNNSDYFTGLGNIIGGATFIITGLSLGLTGSLVNISKAKKLIKKSQMVQEELNRRGISKNQLNIYPWLNPIDKIFGIGLTYQF